jgi:Rha family phage regulatory protein
MKNPNLTKGKQGKAILALAAQLVTFDRQAVTTNSLVVAEKFQKRHADVLRIIRRMECSLDFSRCNFAPRNYLDDRGKEQPFFEMTRDGFMFLVMGFTGKEAAAWKEKFIRAFNYYEAKFYRLLSVQASEEWAVTRSESKAVRRDLTDVLRRFVEYARGQGSENAGNYYQVITKMVHAGLFEFKDEVKIAKRDRLMPKQLRNLIAAEDVVAAAIDEGIKCELPYKDVFTLAKERFELFASLFPKTEVIDTDPQLALW